jgi:Derlin-2/3
MATFEDWYKSVPLVTRTYMTLCCLTTLAVQLEFVSPLQLYLNFNAIVHQYQVTTPPSSNAAAARLFMLLDAPREPGPLILAHSLVSCTQFWRLITNFLFFDYFNLNFVFHMFFTYAPLALAHVLVRACVCVRVRTRAPFALRCPAQPDPRGQR